MTPEEAVNIYEGGCMYVVRAFLDKYFKDEDGDVPEYFFVGDKIGDVLNVGDYWFNMENMVDALRLNIPVDTFFAWYDHYIDSEHKEGEPRYNLEHYMRLKECKHPRQKPAKTVYGEGETNYFICTTCMKPC